jgi:hypothetical protein
MRRGEMMHGIVKTDVKENLMFPQRRIQSVAILLCLLVTAIPLYNRITLVSAVNSSTALQGEPNPAVNNSDQFAWETFIAISRSANNGTNDSIWETWALQNDVFADPNNPPVWPGTKHQPKVLSPSVKLEMQNKERLERRSNRLQLLRRDRKSSADKLSAQFIGPNPLSEEVRMNKDNFDFIVENNLWFLQGQEAAFNAGKNINFRTEAKEVKAHWKEINATDKPRYHWQQGADGKLYGLIALHVMTKDLPNWLWATWEHVDNPDRCKIGGCQDNFGIDNTGNVSQALKDLFAKAGMGAEWQNYRLTGSQIAFTDSTGRPLILGNSEIEGELGIMTTSSCITCHAKASVNGSGDSLSPFAPDGQSDNGTPNPTWFYDTTVNPAKRKFMQLDFEWSLSLAQPRK